MLARSNEGPLLDLRLLTVSSQGRRGKGALWGLFTKGINLMRSLPSWPNQLPKAPPPKTTASGIRISAYEFAGDTNIQTILSNSKEPSPTFYVSVEAE